MKNVLFVFSILTVVTIYSTGAFIPDSHGIAETTNGLEVLSDSDMIQQVGGIWPNCKRGQCYAVKTRDKEGRKSNCVDNIFVPCLPDNQTRYTSLFSCNACNWVNQHQKAKKYFLKKAEIHSTCKTRNSVCTYVEVKVVKKRSCEDDVGNLLCQY